MVSLLVGYGLLWQLASNPVAVALGGLGLAWLMYRVEIPRIHGHPLSLCNLVTSFAISGTLSYQACGWIFHSLAPTDAIMTLLLLGFLLVLCAILTVLGFFPLSVGFNKLNV